MVLEITALFVRAACQVHVCFMLSGDRRVAGHKEVQGWRRYVEYKFTTISVCKYVMCIIVGGNK